jgi:LPXTG-motif cell wall-anchored protein
VLGVQISKTEPAFTGSGSTTQLLGFLGFIALSLGALLLLSPRRRSGAKDQ